MNILETPEQTDLRMGVRRLLAKRSPSADIRRTMESEDGFDRSLWRELCENMGLMGIAVPAEYGGFGGGYAEIAAVMEEFGRAQVCAPYMQSKLAAGALMACSDEIARHKYLSRLASGELIGTLAFAAPTVANSCATGTVEAVSAGEDWTLTGYVDLVIYGHIADLIIIFANSSDGPSLFAVSADAKGVTRTSVPNIDETRKLGRVELNATPSRLLCKGDQAQSVHEAVIDLSAFISGAEALGGATRCLEMSVDYAMLREQFGRPIGSFQALKHRLADLFVDVEAARSIVAYGAAVADTESSEFAVVASMAKSFCSDVFCRAAGEAIQIHGGTGFTWDHDAHLYFKRAHTSARLLGDVGYHRERTAALLGI